MTNTPTTLVEQIETLTRLKEKCRHEPDPIVREAGENYFQARIDKITKEMKR